MNRIIGAKAKLQELYDKYNETWKKKLPSLDLHSKNNITQLLETIHRRESLIVRHEDNKYPVKLSKEIRGAIADILLLMDNFDIEKTKIQSNKG